MSAQVIQVSTEPGAARAHLRSRARILMGTLVRIDLRIDAGHPDVGDAAAADAAGHARACMNQATLEVGFAEAFARIGHIAQVMSAHDPRSDLGRLARARPGQVLTLDPDTVTVLRLARRHWMDSGGRFDPARAGACLAARGQRPGLRPTGASLGTLQWLGPDLARVEAPLALDLGGIAKGYAVDQAVLALRRAGIVSGLVNAGGDLRAFGPHAWPVRILHRVEAPVPTAAQRRPPGRPKQGRLRQGLGWAQDLGLRDAALASSVAAPAGLDFVCCAPRRSSRPRWLGCSVLAPDAASADALTKWGLQGDAQDLALKRVLRAHQARMWRTA